MLKIVARMKEKERRMTTNAQPTRPPDSSGDPSVVEPTPVVTPSGVGGVAVYDRNAEDTIDSSRPSATLGREGVPVETRSSGSVMTWIIAAIVVIVLVYFLFQFIF
jgi:hypothetical protein